MSEIPQHHPDDPAVRDALAQLREWDAAAPQYDVAAGADRFRASLGLPPTPPAASGDSAPPSAASSGSGWSAVLAVAAAAAVVVGGAAVLRASGPGTATAAVAPAFADMEVEPDPPPVHEPPDAPIEAKRPTPLPEVPRAAPAPAEASERPVAPRKVRRAPAPPPSELALVRQMRSALSGHPERALRLALDLDRHHPEGVLLEERRALRVLALDGAGQHARARAAAKAFLAAHPGSAFATRVRAVAAPAAEKRPAGEVSSASTQGSL